MESMVNNELEIFNGFFARKTVLVTGHTGFKGSWLSIWLHELGAKVIGLSLDPYSERDNFVLSGIENKIIDVRGDIRDSRIVNEVFEKYKPAIVFHLAAQPLVRLSYSEPVNTYETNVMGTIHIMEAIRATSSVNAGVLITTDKCYENHEQLWGYRESDAMGGYDPYSSSKGAAEIAIASWRRSYKLPIASVRAGNVIGGGDWALDRIIPDCIRAIEADKPIDIRNPKAIRPWQHVLEPLGAYMLLAQKLYNEPVKYAESWNVGPELSSVSTVKVISEMVIKQFDRGALKDVSDPNQLHEASLLMLDITKANLKLGWRPRLNIDQTIELTVDWYKRYLSENVYNLCLEQIKKYLEYCAKK
jgi:CDP-glucose 4,6-dehydratase